MEIPKVWIQRYPYAAKQAPDFATLKRRIKRPVLVSQWRRMNVSFKECGRRLGMTGHGAARLLHHLEMQDRSYNHWPEFAR